MTVVAPIQTDHPAAWHVEKFVEFAERKADLGEPSPHMTLVGWLSRDVGLGERLWRAGCYLNPYSVLSAEAIWREFSFERIRKEPEKFGPWLRANWDGIHTRQERRCVRTPAKFITAMLGYAEWLADAAPGLAKARIADPIERYDVWWKSATSVPYFGRYITIRLLEFFNRYGHMGTELYDIRSIDGWSPIRALMLLRPDATDELLTGKAGPVDRVAREVVRDLRAGGLMIGFYGFAALLCEYRVAIEKSHQYPGWTIDQELEFDHGKHAEYWRSRGQESGLMQARRALFPKEVLGELHGWTGRRYDLAACLRDRGYVWSDMVYDYAASKDHLDSPVAR